MIRKWITKIVDEQIMNAMKEDEEMPRRVARQMNIGQVAEWMEASDIAEHFDAYDIAQNMDIDDVASNIDSCDVAEHLEVGDVAQYIDMDEVSRYLGDNLDVDYSYLAGRIYHQFEVADIVENIDYEKLAKAVVKHQRENTGEKE